MQRVISHFRSCVGLRPYNKSAIFKLLPLCMGAIGINCELAALGNYTTMSGNVLNTNGKGRGKERLPL